MMLQLTEAEMAGALQRLRQIGQTVAEVMTSDPITVSTGATVSQAVKLMSERAIKRLPVVDADGQLVGLVGRSGILQVMAAIPE